jgi:hypothetical protein
MRVKDRNFGSSCVVVPQWHSGGTKKSYQIGKV